MVSALSRVERFRRAIAVGVLSWLVGLAVTYGLLVAAGGEPAAFVASAPVMFTSFAYSTMHLWPIAFGGDQPLLFIGLAPIPMTILGIGGYYLAAAEGLPTPRQAARGGAAITLGYFAMAILSVSFMLVRGNWGLVGSVVLDLRPTAVVAIVLFGGLLFPLGFGALGGVVYAKRRATGGA